MKIAAIDIGSNSIHLIIAEASSGSLFEIIDREKDFVKLGAGAFSAGRLTPEAFARGVECLKRMSRVIARYNVDATIAVATSAVREAANGAEFLETIRRETGVLTRVISGEQEARLIHLAVRSAFDLSTGPVLILDMGGGSVEAIVGDHRETLLGRSMPLGVHRLRDLAGENPLSGPARRKLEEHVADVAAPVIEAARAVGFGRAIGTSGTILSLGLSTLARQKKNDPYIQPHGRVVTLDSLRETVEQLAKATVEERRKIPGIDSERADTVHVGGVALVKILELAGAEGLMLCGVALREGIVQDALERDHAFRKLPGASTDLRQESADRLLARCAQDVAHARLIARLSLEIFDATARWHGLGDVERRWLEFGALLHDVGRFISFERHEQHSYYIIRNGGLRGFADDELQRIALIARFHRKAKPKPSQRELSGMAEREQQAIILLSSIVRFAEGLDRRHAQLVCGLKFEYGGQFLRIAARASADPSVELWNAREKSGPLSRALEKEIQLTHDVNPAQAS